MNLTNTEDKSCKYAFVYNQLRPDDDDEVIYAKSFLTNIRAQRAVLRGAKLYDNCYAIAKLEKWRVDKAAPRPESLEDEPVDPKHYSSM